MEDPMQDATFEMDLAVEKIREQEQELATLRAKMEEQDCGHPRCAIGKVNDDDPVEEPHCLWCGDIQDMNTLSDSLTTVYEEMSGLTNPMTCPKVVIGIAVDRERERADEEIKEATDGLRADLAAERERREAAERDLVQERHCLRRSRRATRDARHNRARALTKLRDAEAQRDAATALLREWVDFARTALGLPWRMKELVPLTDAHLAASPSPAAEGDGAGRECVNGLTFRELVERAVSAPRDWKRRQPRWSAVGCVFSVGSTTASELCKAFGLNPDETHAESNAQPAQGGDDA